MRHFPAFLDLQGRRALVLGHGEAAERKAGALRRCGAEVICARFYCPLLLDGCAVAVGAEALEADLQALSAEARRRGIPVNVVDRSDLCSFITPAIVDRDPLLVAISSGGTAPVLARLVRARIEALVPPAYGRLAALADRFKDLVRERLPDMQLRRRVLESALGGRVADLVFAGDEAAAEIEMTRQISGGAALAGGIVHLVGAGPGAADLLTLRGQRLMGEADVIAHDPAVTPEVLDIGRRDAARVAVEAQDAAKVLIRLARDGRKVVRLQPDGPAAPGGWSAEAAALAAAGIAFEIVPGVSPPAPVPKRTGAGASTAPHPQPPLAKDLEWTT